MSEKEPTVQEKTAQLVKQAVEEAILPLRQEIAGIKSLPASSKKLESSPSIDLAQSSQKPSNDLEPSNDLAQSSQKPEVISVESLMHDPVHQQARAVMRAKFLRDLQGKLSPLLVHAIAFELEAQIKEPAA